MAVRALPSYLLSAINSFRIAAIKMTPRNRDSPTNVTKTVSTGRPTLKVFFLLLFFGLKVFLRRTFWGRDGKADSYLNPQTDSSSLVCVLFVSNGGRFPQ